MLSSVDHFDFNWHITYLYADDVAPLLPAGTVLHMIGIHDNTAANRAQSRSEDVGRIRRAQRRRHAAGLARPRLSRRRRVQPAGGRTKGEAGDDSTSQQQQQQQAGGRGSIIRFCVQHCALRRCAPEAMIALHFQPLLAVSWGARRTAWPAGSVTGRAELSGTRTTRRSSRSTSRTSTSSRSPGGSRPTASARGPSTSSKSTPLMVNGDRLLDRRHAPRGRRARRRRPASCCGCTARTKARAARRRRASCPAAAWPTGPTAARSGSSTSRPATG